MCCFMATLRLLVAEAPCSAVSGAALAAEPVLRSCPTVACGTLPARGSDPSPHQQADSHPLYHQGHPLVLGF